MAHHRDTRVRGSGALLQSGTRQNRTARAACTSRSQTMSAQPAGKSNSLRANERGGGILEFSLPSHAATPSGYLGVGRILILRSDCSAGSVWHIKFFSWITDTCESSGVIHLSGVLRCGQIYGQPLHGNDFVSHQEKPVNETLTLDPRLRASHPACIPTLSATYGQPMMRSDLPAKG